MKRFQNILVQVDTRRDEQPLLARAIELATAHQAELKIVDVLPDFSWPVRLVATDYNEIRQALVKQKDEAVQKLAEGARAGGLRVAAKVLCGKSSDQIVAEVVRYQHDLVMKDAKGQFSHHPGAFGTTAMRLIRYCPCPVWAFRPRGSNGRDRIVAAVDATSTDDSHLVLNQDILHCASALADGSLPEVAHVWSVYGEHLIKDYMKRDEFEALVLDAESRAREQIQRVIDPFQIPANDPRVHLLRGDAAEELIRFVNQGGFDVLVLGTVARTGLSGLLVGNTAETLINRVECSVVAVKPSGFVTPLHVA